MTHMQEISAAKEHTRHVIDSLRALSTRGGEDVEGHGDTYISEEKLKEAIEQAESSLAALEAVSAEEGGGDTEGQARTWSDRNLKHSISKCEGLAALARR